MLRATQLISGSLLFLTAAFTFSSEISVKSYRLGTPVSVSVFLDDQPMGTTGEDGHMLLSDLGSGQYAIRLIGEENSISLMIELADGKAAYVSALIDESGEMQSGSIILNEGEPEPSTAKLSGFTVLNGQEKVANALINVIGADITINSDLEGAFEFELPQGEYSIEVSAEGYSSRRYTNIVVVPFVDLTLELSVMDSTSAGVEEMFITGSQVDTNSAISIEREATSVIDVIDIGDIKRTDESDIASALAKVSSVSLEDGRFAVVRGLTGRYGTTTINGAAFGGTDPYRRDVALDLFPSFILSNLEVQKSFTADKSAESTASSVNINTSVIPDEAFFKFSMSSTLVDDTTGEALADHRGSDSDWLGVDDGLRDRPDLVVATTGVSTLNVPDLSVVNEQIAESFIQRNEIIETDAAPNFSASTSFADSYGFGDGQHEWGYIVGLKYNNKWSYREGEGLLVEVDSTASAENISAFERGFITESRTANTVELGSIVAFSADFYDKHSLSLNSILVRDGEKATDISDTTVFYSNGAEFDVNAPGQVSDTFLTENYAVVLEWTERQAFVNQLVGTHGVETSNTNVDWIVSLSETRFEQPDRISYGFAINETLTNDLDGLDEPNFLRSDYLRSFEDLQDDSEQLAVNIDQQLFEIRDFESSLSLGWDSLITDRRFTRYTYGIFRPAGLEANQSGINPCGEKCDPFDLNPDDYLTKAAFGATYFFDDLSNDGATNIGLYDADTSVRSTFASASFSWLDRVDINLGVRREDFDLSIVPYEQPKVFAAQYTRDAVTNNPDPRPSELASDDSLLAANFTVYLPRQSLFRYAYSETLSRPSFTEAADGGYFDSDLGLNINGNPDLEVVYVRNYDYRLEHYFSDEESASFAYFRKYFTNPIELALDSVSRETGYAQYIYQNADSGFIEGLELDARKLVDYGSHQFFAQGNFTYIESELVLTEAFIPSAVTGSARENFDFVRSMSYQPEYIANVTLGYDFLPWDLSATLALNRTGPKYSRLRDARVDLIVVEATTNVKMLVGKSFETEKVAYNLVFSINNLTESAYQESLDILDNYRRYDTNREYKLNLSAEF